MKVADYIVKFLADKGIDTVWLVYGSAIGHLVDAFSKVQGIKYICTQHEQGGGFAAEGWAKVKGLPGVSMATSGPGGTNLLTSIANCWYDSVPSIFIVGNVKTQFMKKSEDLRQIGFQENNICEMTKHITKLSVQVRNPKHIGIVMDNLWEVASSKRPGPVLLDLPMDIAGKEIDVDYLNRFDCSKVSSKSTGSYCLNDNIDRYLCDLQESLKPSILVGGGCFNYRNELKSLIDKLGIPVFPTWNALDIVTSDNPYYGGRIGTYGGDGFNIGIQQSDLLLILGSRVSGRITGGNPKSFASKAKTYCVDIDRGLLCKENQQRRFDVNIECDVGEFIKSLDEKISKISWITRKCSDEDPRSWDFWIKQCIELRDKNDPVLSKYFEECRLGFVHPYAFCRVLSEEASKDAVIVGDCGGNIVTLNHSFKTKWGQRYITNNGNSPMGFSLCGAIGAAVGVGWKERYKPNTLNVRDRNSLIGSISNRQIICVIGDGGFQVNIQELQTIKHYKIPVKVFVLNNGCYGITRQYQRTNFEGREMACGPDGYSVPDICKVVSAYGIKAVTCEGMMYGSPLESVRSTIRNVLDEEGPIVCDVKCKDFDTYLPRVVGWSTPIDCMEMCK